MYTHLRFRQNSPYNCTHSLSYTSASHVERVLYKRTNDIKMRTSPFQESCLYASVKNQPEGSANECQPDSSDTDSLNVWNTHTSAQHTWGCLCCATSLSCNATTICGNAPVLSSSAAPAVAPAPRLAPPPDMVNPLTPPHPSPK